MIAHGAAGQAQHDCVQAFDRRQIRGVLSGFAGVPGRLMGGLAQEAGTAARSVTQAASFFAQAYTINDGSSYSNPGGDSLTGGQTVISYRGTDEPSPLKSADFWNGWTIGAGYSAASQAGLARSFYESVINAGNTGPQRTVFDVPPPGVVVTGHSLGGGLVSNDNAVLAEARAA